MRIGTHLSADAIAAEVVQPLGLNTAVENTAQVVGTPIWVITFW